MGGMRDRQTGKTPHVQTFGQFAIVSAEPSSADGGESSWALTEPNMFVDYDEPDALEQSWRAARFFYIEHLYIFSMITVAPISALLYFLSDKLEEGEVVFISLVLIFLFGFVARFVWRVFFPPTLSVHRDGMQFGRSYWAWMDIEEPKIYEWKRYKDRIYFLSWISRRNKSLLGIRHIAADQFPVSRWELLAIIQKLHRHASQRERQAQPEAGVDDGGAGDCA